MEMFFTFCYLVKCDTSFMHHQRRILTAKPTAHQDRFRGRQVTLHNNVQPQDTKAECITEYTLPTTSKLLAYTV